MNINFYDKFFYPIVRYRAQVLSDYMTKLGGLLPFFAGVSLFSLAEFACHFLRFIFSKVPSKNHSDLQQRRFAMARRSSILNDNNFMHQFSKYCQKFAKESSIHGLAYAVDSKQSRATRIFLTTFAITFSVMGTFLIIQTVNHAELNPTIVSVDGKSWSVRDVSLIFLNSSHKNKIFQIPLPAITFCPDPDLDTFKKYKDCFYGLHHPECDAVNETTL